MPTYVGMSVYLYACMSVRVHVCACARGHACARMCARTCACMCACARVHVRMLLLTYYFSKNCVTLNNTHIQCDNCPINAHKYLPYILSVRAIPSAVFYMEGVGMLFALFVVLLGCNLA